MSFTPPAPAVVNAANSTTALLNANAAFTGTAIDLTATPVATIKATVHSDVQSAPNGFQLQFSTDSSDWDIIIPVTVPAHGSMTLCSPPRAKYARIVYTNGATNQGHFDLQTLLTSLSGQEYVSINSLSDGYGFTIQSEPMHTLQTDQPVRMVGASFASAIDTNFWTASNTGAASASGVASSIATLTSGTANSGNGKLVSVRSAWSLFAHPNKFRAAIRLTALTKANTTRAWGQMSLSGVAPQNGVYFSVDGNDVLSVNYATGSSVTSIASGSFNGVTNAISLDTNVHSYEIISFTMGIWFFVDGLLIHTVKPTTAPLYLSLSVPIGMYSANSAGGTVSATLECWNSSILRLGREVTMPTSKYCAGTGTYTVKLDSGCIRGLVINNITASATITIYDNTAASGTIIWASGAIDNTGVSPFSLDFHGLPFFTGLTIIIASGAGCNVTVIYE